MKYLPSALLGFLLMGGAIPQMILSHTITVENSSGESFEFNVDKNDRFLDVLNQLQTYFQGDQFTDGNQGTHTFNHIPDGIALCDSQWSLVVSHGGITARAKKNNYRDYQASVSKEEKSYIAYIVKTLAYDSVISIGKQKSDLESAGDKIDHVHPLCFLRTVFTNEELKAGIAAIRDRVSWIKDGFFDGLYDSMKEEAARKNLLPFVSDFAAAVGIRENLIRPSLEKGKWKECVDTLIDKIPRENDPNRYNM